MNRTRERALILMMLISVLAGCAKSAVPSLQRRIQHVENGLLSTYADPPWKRMELAERMKN